MREYLACFVEQYALVGVACRVVAYEQAFGAAEACHLGCLACGAVAGLLGTCCAVVGKGGLVEEEVGIACVLHVIGIEACVAAVYILTWRGGRCGETTVGDYLSLRRYVVLAVFDAVYLAEGDFVEVDHLALDMCRRGLFLEYESATGYAVAQGEGSHAHRAVFVDDVGAAMGEGVELHAVGHALAEEVEPGTHECLQFGEGVYVQGGGASQEPEGGDEAHQPEAVVAMQVRDEDVPEAREAEAYLAVLALCGLTAVDHVELVAQVDDLRCGVVACGGQCRAAAEDVYFELLHVCIGFFCKLT